MKKAQAAGGAAGFVAVLALIIVLYILFLPADVREELLEEEGNGGASSVIEGAQTILLENPGRLDYLMQKEYEHPISPITLFKTTGSKELWKENPFYIKNGWFDKKSKNISFYIDNIDVVDKVLLTFNVKEGKGMLTITINGVNVFEGVPSSNVEPIRLRKENLKRENVLEFEVSSVGAQFWSTNEYTINSLKVVGDITDTTRQESRNVFMISAVEYFNLDTSVLKFNPDCMQESVGVLSVHLNNRNVFSGVPDCAILNSIDVPPEYLNQGSNNLVFKTESGSYLVDHIKLKTDLKELRYPFYSFNLNSTITEEIIDGKLNITMFVNFIDDKEYRKAKVYINGHVTHLSTDEDVWTKNLRNYVEEGMNELEIVPDRSVLDITELKVIIEDISD